MFFLKCIKFCKQFCGCMIGDVKGGDYVVFGDYGLIVMEFVWIKSNQIEVCCIVMSCYFCCGGKIYICIFFDKFVIKKFVEI